MSDFERLWAAVNSSADANEEARHVDELVAYARKRSLQYEITVLDAQTEQPFPVAQLGTQSKPFAVRIRVKDRTVTLDWRPKSVANAQKLLME